MTHGSLGNCTLEAFIATGRDSDDIGLEIGEDWLRGVGGRIYCDAYWAVPCVKHGIGWTTIISNIEYKSPTLDGIERELHYFMTAG